MPRGIISSPPSSVLSHEDVLKFLRYDPDTGIFVWKVSRSNCAPVGTIAGFTNPGGHRVIGILGTYIYAHRLAWFYVTGAWPEAEIDHINGEKDDNRFANLRAVTRSQNAKNLAVRSDNTSGIKGVSWDKQSKRWVARIMAEKKMIVLGWFVSKEDAAAAYRAASKQYHGEFARTDMSDWADIRAKEILRLLKLASKAESIELLAASFRTAEAEGKVRGVTELGDAFDKQFGRSLSANSALDDESNPLEVRA